MMHHHSDGAVLPGHDPRCGECGQALPEYGGIVADSDRLRVTHGGMFAKLRPHEFEIFRLLLNKRGRTASKEYLLEWLYQFRPDCDWPDIKIIDQFLVKLRKALKPLGLTIGTVWSGGVYLAPPGAGPHPQETLFEAIAHGDAAHRAWLRSAIAAHFAGQPVPPPAAVLPAETAPNTASNGEPYAETERYFRDMAGPVSLIRNEFSGKKGEIHGP